MYPLTDVTNTSYGIDMELFIPVKFLYVSAGINYTDQSIEASDGYDYYVGDYFTWDNFYTTEIYIGSGGVYSLSRNFQLFAGINIGYLLLTLGSDYGNDATGSTWGTYADESAGGFSYGGEIGADYFLGSICLSVKYKLSYSGGLRGDKIFTDSDANGGYDTSFGTSGLVVSAGYGF